MQCVIKFRICNQTKILIHVYKTSLKKTRKIHQYDINGIFIGEFSSIIDDTFRTNNNKTRICDVCRGRRKNSYNFI